MRGAICTLLVLAGAAFVVHAQEPTPPTFLWVYENSSCTRTCGVEGVRTTLTICTLNGNIAQRRAEPFCDAATKLPVQSYPCFRVSCPAGWVSGPWGACSATCAGVRTRSVTCRQNVVTSPFTVLEQQVNDSNCLGEKPADSELCGDACPTYSWGGSVGGRTGVNVDDSWGPCSAVCGRGVETREIVCEEVLQNGDVRIVNSDACLRAVGPEPNTTRNCIVDCNYVSSDWSDCVLEGGDRCGNGTQTRAVFCRSSISGRVSIDACDEDTLIRDSRPASSRGCLVRCECTRPFWAPNSWSDCSVSCGNGTRTRNVSCQCPLGRETQNVDRSFCDRLARSEPATIERCGELCPCDEAFWNLSPWGSCSFSCAGGIQTRQVSCICNRGGQNVSADDVECTSRLGPDKPPLSRICSTQDCPCTNPRWKTGVFSNCLRPCGGNQTRDVTCVCNIQTSKGIFRQDVNDSLCAANPDSGARPPMTRECQDRCCYEALPLSPWTRCSASCGSGTQTRTVTCGVRVCSRRAFVGQTDDVYCTDRGIDLNSLRTRECSAGVKAEKFIWATSEWSTCSNTCGGGYKRRKVRCVDRCAGKKVATARCSRARSPSHKKSCKCVPCDKNECRDREQYPCYFIHKLGVCRVGGCKLQNVCCKSCYNDVITEA